MKISKYLHSMLLLMVLLVVVSAAALSGTISGNIVGVPTACRSNVILVAPETIQLHPGDLESVQLTLTNVSCGISYVRFELIDFPAEYYEHSPTYIPNLPPGKSAKVTLYFNLPYTAETLTYEATYRFYTNEGTFNLGQTEIEIVDPEKPAAEIKSVAQKAQIEVKGKGAAENARFWFFVALFSAAVAIIIISYEYFAVSGQTAKKQALKRSASSIYKVLGLTPERTHKEEFGEVLKKGKRKKSK